MTRREALSALTLPALAAPGRPLGLRLLSGLLSSTALAGCASAPTASPTDARIAPAPRVRLRDRWRYAGTNQYNKQPIGELINEIIEAGPQLRVRNQYSDNRQVPDSLYTNAWNVVRQTDYDLTEQFAQPVPVLPAQLAPGATERLKTTYYAQNPDRTLFWSVYVDARHWEKIRVPAGEFDCLRVDRRIWFAHSDVFRTASERFETLWYAPDVNRWVQREWTGYYLVPGGRRGSRFREDWTRWQLIDHIPAPVSG